MEGNRESAQAGACEGIGGTAKVRGIQNRRGISCGRRWKSLEGSGSGFRVSVFWGRGFGI